MNVPLTPVRFLERTLKVYGGKTGVICGSRRFSYPEYGSRVNRLSNGLLNLGANKGDRISYLGYNCHRLLEAFYAVPQIGAVLMPLNIRLTPKDFEYIINESRRHSGSLISRLKVLPALDAGNQGSSGCRPSFRGRQGQGARF